MTDQPQPSGSAPNARKPDKPPSPTARAIMKRVLDRLRRQDAEVDGFAQTASERFEALAAAWAHDQSVELPSNLDLLALHCWTCSTGGEATGVSQTLKAYYDAAMAAALQANDIDRLLSTRLNCGNCGHRYKIENFMICTHCLGLYCHGCVGHGQKVANGNWQCRCGGEIVG